MVTPEGLREVARYADGIGVDTRRVVPVDAAGRTLDFGQLIAIMLLGVLNFIPDNDDALALVDRLITAVPAGSFRRRSNRAGPGEPATRSHYLETS